MKSISAASMGVFILSLGSFLPNGKTQNENRALNHQAPRKNSSFVADGINYKVEPSTTHIYDASDLKFYFNHTYWTQQYRYEGDHRDYYMEYQIERAEKHQGVYTNFFPSFYSRAVLSTGAVESSQTIENQYYYGIQHTTSSSYQFATGALAEMILRLAVNDVTIGTSTKIGIGFGYAENLTWSYASSFVGSSKTTRKLDSRSAKYCPPECSISIGLVGEWYEIHGSFKEWHNVMFFPDQIVKESKFVLRFAPLAQFTETYIYLMSDNTLGYLAPKGGLIMAKAPLPKC